MTRPRKRPIVASEAVEARARQLERSMRVETPDGKRSLALALASAEAAAATLDVQREATGLDGDRARALASILRSIGKLTTQAGLDRLPRRRSRAQERSAELRALPIAPAVERPAERSEPIATPSSPDPPVAPPPAAPVLSLEDLIRAPGRTG